MSTAGFYLPGHPWALTSDECDRLVDEAGPRVKDETDSDIPKAPCPSWLYERISMPCYATAMVLWGLDPGNWCYGKILEYAPGAELEWHTDDTVNAPDWQLDVLIEQGRMHQWQVDEMRGRRLSVMIQLSEPDDYEGGELQLRVDGEAVTMPKDRGTVLVARSSQEHQVTRLVAGRRLSCVVFVGVSERAPS